MCRCGIVHKYSHALISKVNPPIRGNVLNILRCVFGYTSYCRVSTGR
jgi:hypothetical protein